jgi:Icc-related predicted phosphoesterase
VGVPRVRIMSDLHIEFGNLRLQKAGEDVIALAGDVYPWTNAVTWADEIAKRLDVAIVLVPGNHEFYRNPRHRERTFTAVIDALRDKAARTNGRVTVLHRSTAVVAGVRFIGTTLWSDFLLYNDRARAMNAARIELNDYRGMIGWTAGEMFSPERALEEHERDRAFLASAGRDAQSHEEPVVVITHFAPSARSVPPAYATDILSAAYASALDELVTDIAPTLWVHGHMHSSSRYSIGVTQVVCNPRGYHGLEINRAFDPNLVVDVRR